MLFRLKKLAKLHGCGPELLGSELSSSGAKELGSEAKEFGSEPRSLASFLSPNNIKFQGLGHEIRRWSCGTTKNIN